jgi:hypothetical protein
MGCFAAVAYSVQAVQLTSLVTANEARVSTMGSFAAGLAETPLAEGPPPPPPPPANQEQHKKPSVINRAGVS